MAKTTKKTAAGAQQYTSKTGTATAMKVLDPDIKRFIAGDISVDEFKKKHGVHPLKASSMLYSSSAAERSVNRNKDLDKKGRSGKDRIVNMNDEAEKNFSSTGKRYNKGGSTTGKKYNKGGYVACGASNPASQKRSK
tara:strand:+ start:539 stop:949 length:411 start_codon:yes stop_codon:yes gene_type:complete